MSGLLKEIESARNRFYPNWWACAQPMTESLKPFYRVICHSNEEARLALAVKPDSIRAKIVTLAHEDISKHQIATK